MDHRPLLKSRLDRSRARGLVSVEMLLGLFPILFSFLGIAQLVLLWIGKLVVTHAATRAARSAIVVLEDDPKHYDNAPRGDLKAGNQPEKGALTELWADLNVDYVEFLDGAPLIGGARHMAIREAAFHPLAVLAPASLAGKESPLHDVLGGPSATIGQDIISLPELRVGAFGWAYNRAASAVTVHTSPDGPAVSSVGPRDPITVKVAYLMKCEVPLVGVLICQDGEDLAQASLGVESSQKAKDTIKALAQVASPVFRDFVVAGGGRYQLITASATLPNQGAAYYRSK